MSMTANNATADARRWPQWSPDAHRVAPEHDTRSEWAV